MQIKSDFLPSAFLFIFIISVASPLLAADYVGKLSNGMEVVLVENHSVPMIASNIIIKSGARDESWNTWGAAHFLEHLLFNGTTNRTQEELYEQFDRIGAYHNAHTGSHFVDFMLLTPKNNFATGFDIMTDMVFNSNLPTEKFEKERGIVIEEIARSHAMGPDIDGILKEALFDNTPLSREVLGTVESISRLDRDSVLAFYHRWYVPNNMLLFVTGDFFSDMMVTWLEKHLSQFPPQALPNRAQLSEVDFNALTAISPIIRKYKAGSQSQNMSGMGMGMRGMTGTPQNKRTLYLITKAPQAGETDFVTAMLLESVINSRMDKYLPQGVSGYLSMIQDPDVALFQLSFQYSGDENTVISIKRSFYTLLTELIKRPPNQDDLNLYVRKYRAEQIFNSERLHYYGIMNASYWALVSWDEFESWESRMELVTPKQIVKAAKDWLLDSEKIVLDISPMEKSDMPVTDDSVDTAVRKVLPIGLTSVTVCDPTARVFALHVVAKNRSAWDSRFGVGCVDLLHRLIADPSRWKKYTLGRRLDEISATLKTADDPSIPYDNYYTSPEYSFIRLEVLPEYWMQGVDLLVEMLSSMPTEESCLTNARDKSLASMASEGRSPAAVGSSALRHKLLPDSPLAASTYGDVKTISPETLENLRSNYFDPQNLIITIASPIEADRVVKRINDSFSKLPSVPVEITVEKKNVSGSIANFTGDTLKLGRAQGAVLKGKVIDNIDINDRPGLIVANSYLNEILGMTIREGYGLAYSLGSSIIMRPSSDSTAYGLWELSVSTRPENLGRVVSLMDSIITEIQHHEFTEFELDKIKNAIAGRMMMRTMSRIGQAYSMGMGEFYWGDSEMDAKTVDAILNIDSIKVKSAISTYLTPDNLETIFVN